MCHALKLESNEEEIYVLQIIFGIFLIALSSSSYKKYNSNENKNRSMEWAVVLVEQSTTEKFLFTFGQRTPL